MSELYQAAKALEKRGFTVRCFEKADDARKVILDMIPKTASVGSGGSMTLKAMGILDELYERGNTVFHSEFAKKLGMDHLEARKKGMTADYFLASSNAITLKGELVNTDGIGNRVAAMFYGPDTVIIVAGRNKIVKNRTEAIARIKNIACPLNARRLEKDTPCAKNGKCGDCSDKSRICRITTIIEFAPEYINTNIFLINEDLGY